MNQIGEIIKELLLNFFLILSPIYFYHFIVNRLTIKKNKIYLGIICGIASILCMTFPIVLGDGFIWDLRWIAFMMAILYGGKIAGAIAGSMLVLYRFSLGGMMGSVNVLLVAVILFIVFLLLKNKFQRAAGGKKLYLGFFYALFTFTVMLAAILLHFWITNNSSMLVEKGPLVFLLMGCSYLLSAILYIIITETIISFSRLKEIIFEAEKMNMISELSKLFSYDVKNSIESTRSSIMRAQTAGSYGIEIHMKQALKELQNTDAIIAQFVSSTAEAMTEQNSISTSSLVTEVVELIKPYANVKGVELNAIGENGTVWDGEPLKLRHALLNVVKNAVDATAKGGRVTIETESGKNMIIFLVTDTGIGMSSKQLDKIVNFQMQSDNKIIGQGLLVTFGFIERMGGTLSYESEIGKGTKAVIRLPLRGKK